MEKILSKIVLLVILAGALPMVSSVQAASDRFFSAIEDLPVAPKTVEDMDAALVFETASGRVAEGYASGQVAKITVQQFYNATLPQLGWTRIAVDKFFREGEILKIDFSAPVLSKGGQKTQYLVYHVRLAPRP